VYAGIAKARIEELRTKAAAENTRRQEDDKRRLAAVEQERRVAADRARQEDQARREAQARQEEQVRKEERARQEEEERRVAAAEQARRLRAQVEDEEARRRAAQPPRISPGDRAAFMGRCVRSCRNDERIPRAQLGGCPDYCDCVIGEDERQFSAADHAQMKADSRAGYVTPKLRQFQGIFATCHSRVFGR
jgi:colicin import membrane protein